MNVEKVEFIWSSEVVQNEEYWKKVINIARNCTLRRIIRCSQIMGRKETEILSAAQIFYPCMQAADIFHLKVDITQLGMDQRKVNMLAREIGPKLGFWKPVVVSHHMLMGLLPPPSKDKPKDERMMEMKMSKSIPDSAIFMTDSEEDIKRKIQKAYCPPKEVNENPIIEYCRYIIFEKFDTMHIKRPKKFGGDLEIQSFEELVKLYSSGELHPADLKNTVSEYINQLVEPVRKHFKHNKHAKKLEEFVKQQMVTR